MNNVHSISEGWQAPTRICRSFIVTLWIFLQVPTLTAQPLKPGFDPQEYSELLDINFLHADTPWINYQVPAPTHARLVYRSPITGLFNRWDMWLRDDKTAIISIRGTVGKMESWLENFHAGMIPAIGELRLSDSAVFRYRLSKDSNAYVHAGWALALGSMAPDIVAHIREYYGKGIRNFLLSGHSQGGAICFLLRSYLQYLNEPGFPKDIIYKTYCSAAPKPGNLYYAYDYDFITRDGWGFRVVNPRDWVPETPFSLQTTSDFNTPNPFMNVKGALKQQKFFVRLVLNAMYNRMDRSTKKASRRMQKLLGKRLAARVRNTMTGYAPPSFVSSHNFTPAGTPVILYPDSVYDRKYIFDGKDIFIHHKYAPYKELLRTIYK
ncbi:lipase family protein [Chitinophaga filiformis]|uniref:lipase family protein n=1 Tax=Chitinophaga filiformis TaxID=104663 RepID=UPI001F4070EC|nr:lipase family protein [Chitinophaga filiformis]MCF6406959.1 lipase family protein [Chitinophaga filiformis]